MAFGAIFKKLTNIVNVLINMVNAKIAANKDMSDKPINSPSQPCPECEESDHLESKSIRKDSAPKSSLDIDKAVSAAQKNASLAPVNVSQFTDAELKTYRETNVDWFTATELIYEKGSDISLWWCGRYVRFALEAGGFAPTAKTPESAKDFGPYLESGGFRNFSISPNEAKAGDVVVIQPTSSNPHGHIAMFDGSAWISDFVQDDFWGSSNARNQKPQFKIYRPS